MNKRDLIKLVSEKLGAAKNETKIAFEVFLQKVAEYTEEDSSIRIPEIGIFHLKKKEQDSDQHNLLFLPLRYNPQEKNKILSFDVNVAKETEPGEESAFNLSIGKPLIPIIGVNRRDFMIQSSYILLQKAFEEGTDTLLSKSVVLTDLKLDLRLIEKDDEGIETFLDEDGSYQPSLESPEVIPWDFGVSPELSTEQSVAEKAEEEDIEIEIPADEVPDFRSVTPAGEQPQSDKEETAFTEEPELSDPVEEKVEESFSQPQTPDSAEEEIKQEFILEDEPEITEKDEQIQSAEALMDQLTADLFSLDNLAPQQDTDKNPEDEPGKDLTGVSEEEFIFSAEEPANIEEHSGDSEAEPLMEAELPVEKDNDFMPPVMETSFPFQAGRDYTPEEEKPDFKIKFGMWFWAILTAFIVLTAGGIYYFMFYNKGTGDEQIAVKRTPVEKNVIERSYEIPVTIIPKSDSAAESSGQSDNAGASDQMQTETSRDGVQETGTGVIKQDEPKQVNTAAQPPSGTDTKNTLVKDYIFTDGTKYTVQISSWRTRSVAEAEVNRLKSGGFPSYLSEYSSGGNKSWYRVRVGEFASLSEAEGFISKNVNKLFK